MKKKKVNRQTMFNLKGFLILIAFGVWIYVFKNKESVDSFLEAVFTFGEDTLMIITVLYILILLLEFFVGIEDTEK